MPKDEHIAVLGRGAAVWNARRAEHDEVLRGTKLSDANLSGARLEGANFFRAALDGADLAGAYLDAAQFLNCAQLIVARNWQSAFRNETLACGAAVPDRVPSE